MKFILLFTLGFIWNCASSTSQAKAYNDSANDAKHKPEEVIAKLKIKPTDVIADLGSGGGYYTLKFAKITKKVYAIDVDSKLLETVKLKAKEENLTNIVTVLANEKNSGLSDSSIDLLFNRDTFHHLPEQTSYFSEIKKSLKPNARVAIIDYKKDANLFIRIFGHYSEEEEILSKMEKAGFKLIEKHNFISDQHFLIFQTNETINK